MLKEICLVNYDENSSFGQKASWNLKINDFFIPLTRKKLFPDIRNYGLSIDDTYLYVNYGFQEMSERNQTKCFKLPWFWDHYKTEWKMKNGWKTRRPIILTKEQQQKLLDNREKIMINFMIVDDCKKFHNGKVCITFERRTWVMYFWKYFGLTQIAPKITKLEMLCEIEISEGEDIKRLVFSGECNSEKDYFKCFQRMLKDRGFNCIFF